MREARLILAGGGNARQSRPLDEQLAAWMGRDATLLYLPLALPEGHRLLAGCEAWIRSVFAPLGVRRVITWYAADVLRPSRPALSGVDGVYLGGGNTFRLLGLLRRSGLDQELTALARAGTPISGGSAGAIVLGRDIGFAEAFGDANDTGLADTTALDLLRDEAGRSWLVLPHYADAWRARARALATDARLPVVGIPEDGGLIIDRGEWTTAGAGEVVVFHPAG